jgi:hypothetical protein
MRQAWLSALLAVTVALGWGCFGEREGRTPSGSGGSDGVDGSSGAAGASGAPATCTEETKDQDACSTGELTLTCEAAEACCRCVNLPPCGNLWACVEANTGVEGCPAEPPATGDSCDSEYLSCEYCTADGPEVMICQPLRGTDPVEHAWSPAHLGMCVE